HLGAPDFFIHQNDCLLLGLGVGRDQSALIASTWIASFTSGANIGTPKFRPKSVRLNSADASAPHTSRFSIGCWMHLNLLMVSVSGLVTPSIVICPSIATGLSPSNLIELPL